MKRFIEGEVRSQSLLFPERLDDYVGEDNPVRAIEVFVESLNLGKLGFEGVEPEATSLSGILCLRHTMSTERNKDAQASQEDAESQRCRASRGIGQDSAGVA